MEEYQRHDSDDEATAEVPPSPREMTAFDDLSPAQRALLLMMYQDMTVMGELSAIAREREEALKREREKRQARRERRQQRLTAAPGWKRALLRTGFGCVDAMECCADMCAACGDTDSSSW